MEEWHCWSFLVAQTLFGVICMVYSVLREYFYWWHLGEYMQSFIIGEGYVMLLGDVKVTSCIICPMNYLEKY